MHPLDPSTDKKIRNLLMRVDQPSVVVLLAKY